MATSASPALLSVQDKTVVEADTGTTTANVKIVLSKRVHKKVSVGYRTVDGDAKAGSDYVAQSGRVKFAKGTKVAFVHVQVIGDKVEEADEHFKVRLFDAYRARIADRVAGVTIVDTDVTPPPPPPPPVKPALSVSDTKADEGEAAYFRVSLDKPAADVVTFRYATSDGTANAGQDYDSTSGVQSIDKGDSWVTVKVMTREDSLYEPGADETFFLNVYKVYNATVADGHGKAFIEDDDPPPPPKLFVKGDTVEEGGKVYFKVFLSETAHHPVFFKYATDDGSALANKDYEPVSHYAVIGKYDRGVVIAVQTKEDSVDEYVENFFLKVFDVKGAIPVDTKGEGLIVDDDAEPALKIASKAEVAEPGTVNVDVQLIGNATEKTVKVSWALAFGTGSDWADAADLDGTVPKSGLLTFTSPDTVESILIKTFDDTVKEGDEFFYVNLSQPDHATLASADAQATVKILTNDATP